MKRAIMMMAAAAVLTTAGCASMNSAPRQAVATPSVCVQTAIPIYFAEASDRLTPAAMQALSAAASPLRGCAIREVVVVGLTQGEDTPANRQLSESRALQVTRALTAQGLPAPRIEAYAGPADAGATPLQRRTEVMIYPAGG